MEISTTLFVLGTVLGLMCVDHTYCAILSRNKAVISSSTFENWVPARMISDDTRVNADICQCCAATSTQLNPWYQLDLGKRFLVRQVYIEGRSETHHQQNFHNMQLFFASIYDGLSNAELNETSTTSVVNYIPLVPKVTRYVSIILRNENRIFTVCRLTVFGDCSDGGFGNYCEGTCHCEGDPCNKTTGVCPSGQCLAGFEGQACDKVCQDGFYERGCEKKCGHCYGNAVCNKTTGICPGKCSPGYQGRRCKTECAAGTYGMDCATVCGKCRDGKPCDAVSGSCLDGCDAGYKSILCNQECPKGTYGINCAELCGNCKNNLDCMVTNGTCPIGCKAGFEGHTCKSECSAGSYGENCKYTCGRCSRGETCSQQTGYCKGGCLPGYQSDFCNKTCDNGYYGDGCITKCGNCADAGFCSKINGTCINGCEEGYRSFTCTEECESGFFGANCKTQCGQCLNGTACNTKNGTCSECDIGYGGHDCTIQLSLKANGQPPASPTTTVIGLVGGSVVLVLVIGGAIILMKQRKSQKSALGKTQLQGEIESAPCGAPNEVPTTTSLVPSKLGSNHFDDHDYYAFITKKQEVKVCQLWDYVYRKEKDGCVAFYQEFSLLKSGLIHPCEIAELPENKPKTRYRNLCAYDHCRVPLETERGGSDYINASFINGPNKERKFIASQGPTHVMRDDFWKMIWQQKSEQIVMLTNLIEMGTEKCIIYWPESEEDVNYGDITVRLESEKRDPDFVIRKLQIRKGKDEWRRVIQYHFRAWPDKDVPDSTWSLVNFWLEVTSHPTYGQYPVVVHCSAGIGRTGTFVALDNAYNQGHSDGVLNVLDTVMALREQRVNMVQTKEQYVFLHEAVADALLIGTHFIWSSQFQGVYRYLSVEVNGIKQYRLKTQYKLIVDSLIDRQEIQQDTKDENEPEYSNVFVNKSSSTGTAEEHMPASQKIDPLRELGVIFLPNYEEEDSFLICKSPTKPTLEAFWTLIAEHNVKTVVMLTDQSSTSHAISANLGATDKCIQSAYKVGVKNSRTDETLTETSLTYVNNDTTKSVRQFEYKSWTDTDAIPNNTRSMLNFLEVVLDWQQRLTSSQPVLVHCSSGSERSGLVCVLLNELERMKREQGHINILQTVKLMKERNESIIPNFDQYVYVYDAISSTLERGDVYVNC